jgi:hypothetical protein
VTEPEQPAVEEPNAGVLIVLLTDGETTPEPDGTRVPDPTTSE